MASKTCVVGGLFIHSKLKIPVIICTYKLLWGKDFNLTGPQGDT